MTEVFEKFHLTDHLFCILNNEHKTALGVKEGFQDFDSRCMLNVDLHMDEFGSIYMLYPISKPPCCRHLLASSILGFFRATARRRGVLENGCPLRYNRGWRMINDHYQKCMLLFVSWSIVILSEKVFSTLSRDGTVVKYMLSRFPLKKILSKIRKKKSPGDVAASEGDVAARELWITTRCMSKISS